jgi:hypothetical protein
MFQVKYKKTKRGSNQEKCREKKLKFRLAELSEIQASRISRHSDSRTSRYSGQHNFQTLKLAELPDIQTSRTSRYSG